MLGLALFPQTLGALSTPKSYETVKISIEGMLGLLGARKGERADLRVQVTGPW